MKATQTIYTDPNGVTVDAVKVDYHGNECNGHRYDFTAGSRSGSIVFQHGPVKEAGVNGLTNEALLEILIHRTEYLDSQFPCNENKIAIERMVDALNAFESRTASRIKRGVEGTNVK
jgi:hypothetical protein